MTLLQKNHSSGFGIVEVLVSVAIVGTILTAVAAGLSMSLKTSAELKFRGIALNKAQAVIEAVRRERSILGWTAFFNLFESGTSGVYTYCFNDDTALVHSSFSLSLGACADTAAWDGNDFIRELTVDATTPDEVQLTSTVYWEGRAKQIELKQLLYKWH